MEEEEEEVNDEDLSIMAFINSAIQAHDQPRLDQNSTITSD